MPFQGEARHILWYASRLVEPNDMKGRVDGSPGVKGFLAATFVETLPGIICKAFFFFFFGLVFLMPQESATGCCTLRRVFAKYRKISTIANNGCASCLQLIQRENHCFVPRVKSTEAGKARSIDELESRSPRETCCSDLQ